MISHPRSHQWPDQFIYRGYGPVKYLKLYSYGRAELLQTEGAAATEDCSTGYGPTTTGVPDWLFKT